MLSAKRLIPDVPRCCGRYRGVSIRIPRYLLFINHLQELMLQILESIAPLQDGQRPSDEVEAAGYKCLYRVVAFYRLAERSHPIKSFFDARTY